MPDEPEPSKSLILNTSRPFNWFHDLLIRLGFKKAPFSTRSQIEAVLSDPVPLGDDISLQERLLLKNILTLNSIRIDDVMIPRADIYALDLKTPLGEALEAYQMEGHSRVILYRDSLDDPVGLLHIKDLMFFMISQAASISDDLNEKSESETQAFQDVVLSFSDRLSVVNFSTPIGELKLTRPLLYVPPSMLAHDLLIQMQASRKHLAVVVDEYGGTDGLISIEDLIEVVVGEIEDEHDTEEKPQMKTIGANSLVADARVEIVDLIERLQNGFAPPEDNQIDTLGGLIFSLLGRVPAKGEIIAYSGYDLEVLDVDARKIKKVKVSKSDPIPSSHKPAEPIDFPTHNDNTNMAKTKSSPTRDAEIIPLHGSSTQ